MPSAQHLNMWTVYRRPRDYPTKFVARLWQVQASKAVMTDQVLVEDNLESIRKAVQVKLMEVGMTPFCLVRQPQDDPVIVETWV